MTLNFFNQFDAPVLGGLPLAIVALAFPLVLLPPPSIHLLPNRLFTVQR